MEVCPLCCAGLSWSPCRFSGPDWPGAGCSDLVALAVLVFASFCLSMPITTTNLAYIILLHTCIVEHPIVNTNSLRVR